MILDLQDRKLCAEQMLKTWGARDLPRLYTEARSIMELRAQRNNAVRAAKQASLREV